MARPRHLVLGVAWALAAACGSSPPPTPSTAGEETIPPEVVSPSPEEAPTDEVVEPPLETPAEVVSGVPHLRFPLRRGVTETLERIAADGSIVGTTRLPFGVRIDSEAAWFEVDPASGSTEAPGFTITSNGQVVALVADAGALAVDLQDGSVRFASRTVTPEPLGFDEARGTVTQGRSRCDFTDARRGRLALVCGERIVLLRGGTRLDLLAANGATIASQTLVPTGRALFPKVDAHLETIGLVYEGRIFVH